VLVKPDSGNLREIKKMVGKGSLIGKISKVFSFNDIKKAHVMSQKGGFSGKLVLKDWI
jgi:NADPH:quinone reductase-like Zn-dependent oxidoreductase